MIVINTYALVCRSTKSCQVHYRNQLHWYIGAGWYQLDQSKEVLNNLSKLNKVSNGNT